MVYVDFNPIKNTYYQSIKSIFMLIKSFLFTYKINQISVKKFRKVLFVLDKGIPNLCGGFVCFRQGHPEPLRRLCLF